MDRYAPVKPPHSIYWHILDCDTDNFAEWEVENSFGVREQVPMRFKHRESADYHAAKLNAADTTKEE